MDIRLHILEAGGSLGRWRSRMELEVEAVCVRVDALVRRRDRRHAIDVVVRRTRFSSIPEVGLGGSCFEPDLVSIDVAPDCEAFERSFKAGGFRTTLAHELHHALRHAACGYGETLGEAIVSEGLADHFAVDVTGCPPSIWTGHRGLSADVMERAGNERSSTAYDHAAWFFGGDDLPRWAGYAIGWQCVATYLASHPQESAASLVGVDASRIISSAWPSSAE